MSDKRFTLTGRPSGSLGSTAKRIFFGFALIRAYAFTDAASAS